MDALRTNLYMGGDYSPLEERVEAWEEETEKRPEKTDPGGGAGELRSETCRQLIAASKDCRGGSKWRLKEKMRRKGRRERVE